MIGNANNGTFRGILRDFDSKLELKRIMNARDFNSSTFHGEGANLLWERLDIGPRLEPKIIFRSIIDNRIFITRKRFRGPVYNCHANVSTHQKLSEYLSFRDCYFVSKTFKNIQMKSDRCNPIIDPPIYFTLNSTLQKFKYNIFEDQADLDKQSLNWFCQYQDEISEKDIRNSIETWLRIMSDKDKELITSDANGMEPFQSFKTPHIDILIGYLANRKIFDHMKYQIFKAAKLLHEGVMLNGNIYANVSIDQMYDWFGTLTIVIGSHNWMNNQILIEGRKFEIQTQLYKSKMHGIVRVWGKFPSDHMDNCESRIDSGLGLICKYSNGLPNGKSWKGLLGGAWIYGEMTEDGEFSGRDIAYINQDLSIGYKGIFQRGLMLNATVVSITGERCNEDGIKILKFSKSTSYSDITFRYKRPNSNSMGDQPFLVDPLDNKYINVGESSIDTGEGSQELKENGAFAKEDIPPQTVMAHNNGYIVNRKERNEWRKRHIKILKPTKKVAIGSTDFVGKLDEYTKKNFDKYTAKLRCNEFLEIPSEIGQSKSKYCSTWGHKINHCFTRQNSEILLYDSAQFGVVSAIKTRTKFRIAKGQEIFSHYGYSYSGGPKWYKDSFRNILMQQNDTKNKEDLHWQQVKHNVFLKENITSVAEASTAVLNKLLEIHRFISESRTNYV